MKVSTLKSLRVAKGYSQWELGKKIGRTQARVSLYEQGHVSIPEVEVKKLAKILKCDPADLKNG